jgi:hypothetical protein
MPYFKNDHVNILFIHIPKTGGSSIELYFAHKFNIPLNSKSLFMVVGDKIPLHKNIIINSSLHHITYNEIVKYNKEFNIDFNNIKIITIVRNPYERMISELFWFKKINIDSSKEEVFNIINEYLSGNYDNYDNHNIPQHYFLKDDNEELITNIHILRTENLTNDMKNLGYTDFNIVSNKNPNKINYYNYLNNKSIKLINEFYHFDFILFNYDKISET